MRHIKPAESSVMREFERLASEKGWITKQAALDPNVARQIRQSLNNIGGMIPGSAVLQTLLPLEENAGDSTDLRHALDAVRSYSMKPNVVEYFTGLDRETASEYSTARSMLHAPASSGHRWLEGLNMFSGLLSKALGKAQPEVKPEVTVPEVPSVEGPPSVETGPMPKEVVPEHLTSSKVVNELVSLANDLDKMGASEAADAVDKQLSIYKEALEKLYDITGETGEQLIGKAHPGGGPTIAPAQEEGGKVETIVEEQKKNIQKATKPPTGKQSSLVVSQLISLANRLDNEGKTEAAMLVDRTLGDIKRTCLPFDGNLRKDAQVVGSPEEEGDRLVRTLSLVSSALKGLESTVEDQFRLWGGTGVIGFPERYKPYTVIWHRGSYASKPNVEFEQFIEEAIDFIDGLKSRSWDIVKDKKAMANTLAEVEAINKNLGTIGRFYIAFGEEADGEWNSGAFKNFHDALKELRGQASEMGAGPREQAIKPSKPGVPSGKVGVELGNFRAAVQRLLSSLEKAQRGDAATREKLFKAFTPHGKAKGISGAAAAIRFIEWLKDLKTKHFKEEDAQAYNRWLHNKYIKPLKPALSVRDLPKLTKQAQEKAPPGAPFEGPAVKPGKPKVPGKRIRLKPSRGDLKVLQQVMLNLGYDLGRTGDDGKWGPKTKAAWERLAKEVKAMRGPDIAMATPEKGHGPFPSAVKAATTIARYLLKVRGASALAVNIAPGIKISENALKASESFIQALSQHPKSGISFKGRSDIMSKANVARATSILRNYRNLLRQPGNPEAWNIWTKGGGAPALRRRVQLIDNLIAQFAQKERLPFGDYSMKGIRGPEGVGSPFGTLERGRGREVEKERGGIESIYGGKAMSGRSLARLIMLNLPSDKWLVNRDKFIQYAQYNTRRDEDVKEILRGWKEKYGRRVDDRRVIAFAYIEALRRRAGYYQRKLEQMGPRQVPGFTALEERIDLVFSALPSLEDEIKLYRSHTI
jgi:hypothetical protein